MKLYKFAIANYKSITSRQQVEINDEITTIVGSNNTGKSNLIKGLATGIALLEEVGRQSGAFDPYRLGWLAERKGIYSNELDYPKSLDPKSKASPIFRFHFRLNEAERKYFKEQLGSSINEDLPVEIKIKRGNKAGIASAIEVNYVKQRAPEKVKRKIPQLCRLITEKFSFASSSAVRPGEDGVREVKKLIQINLESLSENNTKYREAVEALTKFRKEQLDKMQETFRGTLDEFLPDLQSIEFCVNDVVEAQTRNLKVVVDDGVATVLSEKGDGVQSLFNLAVLQYKANQKRLNDQDLLTVIEEPEAHLNSSAMWRLRKVIEEMSKRQQIIVVAHSPIFVERSAVRKNILVTPSGVSQAKTIGDIRSQLGVRVNENLSQTQFQLLVEGETDKAIVEKVVGIFKLKELSRALENEILKITPTGGVKYLENHLNICENQMVTPFVMLDDDEAGREAAGRVTRRGLVQNKSIFYVKHARRKNRKAINATIEDIVSFQVIVRAIEEVWGVTVPAATFERCSPKPVLELVRCVVEDRGCHVDNESLGDFKNQIPDLLHSREDFQDSSIEVLLDRLSAIGK